LAVVSIVNLWDSRCNFC